MLKRIIRPGIVIVVTIVFMAVSNPSEEKFLSKVSSEYGAVHGGASFSSADLLQMGESRRQSYLIFSTYEYEFGTIGVRYVGFLFSVFHVESYREEVPLKKERDEVLAGRLKVGVANSAIQKLPPAFNFTSLSSSQKKKTHSLASGMGFNILRI